MRKSETELRRYTNVSGALDMVLKKRLVLLNPQSWDDRNDSHFLETYRRCCGLETVRAACFSEEAETYHHWKVYASGATGACVIFHRKPFVQFVESTPKLRGETVTYMTKGCLQNLTELPNAKLPFIKRWAYGDEGEYRVIFEDEAACEDTQGVDLPLELIERIVLSPWTPRPLHDSLRSIFRKVGLPKNIEVTRSDLVDTEMWKDALAAIQARQAPTPELK
ncbi:MAG TPA: hypothetical protein VEW71_04740 [Allosphingosinicella sp.]|nr:hypothetical protein [Allosphingosinicella sp.]